jgi:adenylate kinase
MDAGELVPGDLTVAMVHRRLVEEPGGFILDGFPRTPDQARALESMLAEMGSKLDAVVGFVVPEAVLVQRMLERGRTDDTEEVIRRRLEVYRQETEPLLRFYGDQVISIDAVGTVEEITHRVLDALRSSSRRTTDVR